MPHAEREDADRSRVARTPLRRASSKAVWSVALLAAWIASGCSSRSGNPFRIATGYVSHVLCSSVFVSGLDPEPAYAEQIAANPSFRGVTWAIGRDVDRGRREVRVRILGGFEARSVYREGLGCVNVRGGETVVALTRAEIEADGLGAALMPEIAGGDVVEPPDGPLRQVLAAAFAEPGEHQKRTHAVVIVKDGRVVAERYAPGWSVDTPVHGWSATKSVNNALLGILVRQGKLKMDQPAPVAAWQAPDDGRRTITLDQLLRMQSGLDLGDSLMPGFSAAWDPASRGLLTEADGAAFAEAAPLVAAPGTVWTYSDGSPAILGRVVRNAVGGHAADVLRFARCELFGPLGMRHAVLELDAAGSPIMASFAHATPREWARFGMLFLNDGVVGGKRILPEGWVAYSTTPTPNAWVGYGAGWWINSGESQGAKYRRERGMPADSFMAQGVFGQTIVVVPSERLVIARFGTTFDLRAAMEDMSILTRDAIAATREPSGASR